VDRGLKPGTGVCAGNLRIRARDGSQQALERLRAIPVAIGICDSPGIGAGALFGITMLASLPITTLLSAEAVERFTALLGSEYVLTGEAVNPYLANCLSLTRAVPAVLRPANEEQVRAVVKIAAELTIRIYAISTGHNWGYGTAMPVEDDCVLVDLSRMNRILEFDSELGLITLEPGVTQGQLSQYLIGGGHDFFVPTTGAGPSASLVGNALERGFGITPEEDHFGAVRSLRAVLPDATVYQSPLAGFGMPMATSGWKWGIGPYLDGIFSQGNFGIVTSLTIALRRRPEHIEVYVFTLKEDGRFPALASGCQKMLAEMHGIAGGIKFMNLAQYRQTLDTAELGMGLSAKFSWIGFGVLHCRKSMSGAARKEVRSSLKPYVSQVVFLNEGRVKMFEALAKWIPGTPGAKIKRQAKQARDILHIVRGEPRGLELRLVYRHVPIPAEGPRDPVEDGVGIIWYAPIIPLKTETIANMVAGIQEVLRRFDMPEAISLTTVNERCAMGVIPILYRRPEEMEKAHECFRALWQRGKDLGCFPYRVNVAAMEDLTNQGDPVFWRFFRTLKTAIDPDRLFSPGRYGG
jgi:4-cresol dehydrogenase (hydroxylating) flavoprotein subunit